MDLCGGKLQAVGWSEPRGWRICDGTSLLSIHRLELATAGRRKAVPLGTT